MEGDKKRAGKTVSNSGGYDDNSATVAGIKREREQLIFWECPGGRATLQWPKGGKHRSTEGECPFPRSVEAGKEEMRLTTAKMQGILDEEREKRWN